RCCRAGDDRPLDPAAANIRNRTQENGRLRKGGRLLSFWSDHRSGADHRPVIQALRWIAAHGEYDDAIADGDIGPLLSRPLLAGRDAPGCQNTPPIPMPPLMSGGGAAGRLTLPEERLELPRAALPFDGATA